MLVERVTAQDSFNGKPRTLNSSVFFQCLKRVLGAGGDKPTARRSKRRYLLSIKANKRYKKPFHHARIPSFWVKDRKSDSKSLYGALTPRPRTTIITSYPAVSDVSLRRYISLSLRRTRLRFTAQPSFALTVIPSLFKDDLFLRQYKTIVGETALFPRE
jgi:hypothetical protein